MDGGIDDIRAARRDLDAVIDEIRSVEGFRDFLAAPTFDDVAAVASADHPVVYFAAADAGGLAIVVRGSDVVAGSAAGPVTHVPLDALTADAVRRHVGDYLAVYEAFRRAPEEQRDSCRATWREALDAVASWAWSVAVGPVLVELGTVDRAVFIPGGLLGLLPLHAAWTLDPNGADGRKYALDSLTITYVPNARALAAARELAGHPADRLLTVTDPPHAPGIRPLRWAPVETSLADYLMSGPCVQVEPSAATARRVLAEIAAADVAHLACHGIADLINPLDSGLLLAHGDVLRLRDLLALRSQLRLAVLSACETSMPGTELPDEVVALPTGLLQAGVGGVVASLWAVPDLATTLLMAEFYRRWRRVGEQPSDALRSAQLWLRDTTRKQKVQHLVAGVQDGWLPRQECADLLRELFGRNEDERLLTAWAGFAYVGA